MEREILFRGKRVENGEWVKGSYLSLNIGKKYICDGTVWIGTLNPCKYDIIPETVGKYTGLTDKNGRRIFEGDIVKDDVDDTGVVYWDEYYCALMISYIDKKSIYYFHNNDFNEVEVISNIHDNPEMMKGEANV